jgi:hypothetical protein
MNNDNYRVRMVIYSADTDERVAYTDEPLYSGLGASEEMAVQAYRTYQQYNSKTLRR